jgi:hypothetical protein
LTLLMEALLHRGHVPAQLVVEPAFLVGLVLQLRFALAAYLLARLLLRLSDGVRSLILRRRAAHTLAAPPALPSLGPGIGRPACATRWRPFGACAADRSARLWLTPPRDGLVRGALLP